MNIIYFYDKNTKEYLGSRIADPDPEETKIQGKFVPLIPSNAVLIPPPEYGENEIPVLNGEHWEIVEDFRGKFLKVDENLNVSEIDSLGKQDGFFIVERETGLNIRNFPSHYKIAENSIIEKTPEEISEDEKQKRRERFLNEFFETSLGWVRRKVTMKDGSKKDFLSDLLPAIKAGMEMGQTPEIIFYNEPDFNVDYADLTDFQELKTVNAIFIQECLAQLAEDFGI